ncbi:hypothetical protein HEK616_83240 (plasmid) [Streptomyces nigrescens]|uniref:Uncharacterized protein n=1 Tax=Streptomyces nigrescens TaxID=1920 RepID=A0ABN6R901_STRNI|nr:hypothetical protein HEK616_83240 [Streptomyces nigrescens]
MAGAGAIRSGVNCCGLVEVLLQALSVPIGQALSGARLKDRDFLGELELTAAIRQVGPTQPQARSCHYRSLITRLTVTADGAGGSASRNRLSRSTRAYLPG